MSQMSDLKREILYKIAEEAAEVVQACMKALNHGLDSCEPGTSAPTNAERIENELGELDFYVMLADEYKILKLDGVKASHARKALRPQNYFHHIPEGPTGSTGFLQTELNIERR